MPWGFSSGVIVLWRRSVQPAHRKAISHAFGSQSHNHLSKVPLRTARAAKDRSPPNSPPLFPGPSRQDARSGFAPGRRARARTGGNWIPHPYLKRSNTPVPTVQLRFLLLCQFGAQHRKMTINSFKGGVELSSRSRGRDKEMNTSSLTKLHRLRPRRIRVNSNPVIANFSVQSSVISIQDQELRILDRHMTIDAVSCDPWPNFGEHATLFLLMTVQALG
jgi:hypothetical protein